MSLYFFEPPLGGLGATYTVHLTHWKARLPIHVNLTFSTGVMAEALQAIDWKSAFSMGMSEFRPNFRVEGEVLSL